MAYRSRSNGGTRKVVRKESHDKNSPPAPASLVRCWLRCGPTNWLRGRISYSRPLSCTFTRQSI